MKTRSSRSKLSPADTCGSPVLDRFSFGHVMFGLVAAAIALPISFWIFERAKITMPSVDTRPLILFFASLIATAAFISWELLEHSVVKRDYYSKKAELKGWCETSGNSSADIFLGILSFLLYYIPSFLLATDWISIIILTVIPFAVSPVVAYLVMKRK